MKDTANSFGANLKALRKKAGLSQEELAHLVGVHETTVRRWEKNRLPNVHDIKRLAEALHVSEQQLLSPDKEASRWVLTIKVASDFTEEVINVRKPTPKISSVTTAQDGAYLALGGSYEMWANDETFNDFISQIYKSRLAILESGRISGYTNINKEKTL